MVHMENIDFIFPKSLELMKLGDDELKERISSIRDRYRIHVEREINGSYDKKITVLEPMLFNLGIPTRFMMKYLKESNYFSHLKDEEIEEYKKNINILRHRVIELIYKEA